MSASPTDLILGEARAALADQRYGLFTHPFVLGLLVAVALVEGLEPEVVDATGRAHLRPHPVGNE